MTTAFTEKAKEKDSVQMSKPDDLNKISLVAVLQLIQTHHPLFNDIRWMRP